MKRNILFWFSCWSVLALLFLPFPFVFFPKTGILLSESILPLNELICSWLDINVRDSFLISDSLAFYSTALILGVLSLLIMVFIYWKGKKYLPAVQKVLFFTLVLFLSYFLIRYGLDKLFGVQFYTPVANTLHTPVGQLGKDILFWTSMGTSTFYNQFMAITEISAGILILFNRTRFLGLIVGFGVLLNIFAINIGFDITVKYLSGLLFFCCLICLCFYSSNIRFLLGRTVSEKSVPHVSGIYIFVLFLPFLLDLSVTYWNIKSKDSGKSYTVESVSGISNLMSTEELVRIHFHPEGYFITENKQQRFTSYAMKNNGNLVVIDKQPVFISIEENRLLWKENKTEIVWNIKETDLKKMVLKQDKTHWYVEALIPP